MANYIHYTQEQKDRARTTDIVDLLERQGERLKRSGKEYQWLDGSEKVTIRGNLWYHQYEEVGGDAIDFVRKFYNKNYHHTVGAALSCPNGKIYSGVNCGGIHGSCAEYITIGMAISADVRDFDTIVAVLDKAPNCLVAPCGNCRQMLIEYCPDIKVILNDENNKIVKVDIKDLLPFAWKTVQV